MITVRGPGEGDTGYCYLASTTPANPADPDKPGTTLNGGTGTLRAPHARGVLAPGEHPGHPGARPAGHRPGPLQPRRRRRPLGHRARRPGTGRPADHLQVRALRLDRRRRPTSTWSATRVVQSINPLAQLQLEKQVDRSAGTLPAVITAGTVIPYQYTVTNAGQETLSALSIADDTITGPITCDATTLAPAPAAGSTTVCRGTLHGHRRRRRAPARSSTSPTADRADPAGDPVTSPEATVTVPLRLGLDLTKARAAHRGRTTQGQQVEYALHRDEHRRVHRDQRRRHRRPRPVRRLLVCQANVLAPGASTTCTGTYTVDTSAGETPPASIVNTAVATAQTPIGQERESPEAQAQHRGQHRHRGHEDRRRPRRRTSATPSRSPSPRPTTGRRSATDVVITDQLPGRAPDATVARAPPVPSRRRTPPRTGAWSIPALAVGNTVTLTLTARVETNDGGVEHREPDQPDAAGHRTPPTTPTR